MVPLARARRLRRFLRATVLLACTAAATASCSSNPCPDGQRLREEWHAPHKLKSRGCVVRDAEGLDQPTGRWEYFFENGKKLAEGVYVPGGSADGVDGDGILLAGREGQWRIWHPNGRIREELTYRSGKPDGPAIMRYSIGIVAAESLFEHGVLTHLATYDSDGRRLSSRDDLKRGPGRYYVG